MLMLLVVLALIAVVLAIFWMRWRQLARADYIRRYMFPAGLFERLRKRRPELTVKDCQLVARALRQFFLAHLNSGCQFVSMPSQVVDDLWHEFILYTRHYQHFCRRAFGHFLHHTPAVVLGAARQNNAGLRRTWWHTCLEENINPRKPTRLPLLFALDAKLNIADGFRYTLDCAQRRRDGQGSIYCGGDFADPGIDGGTDGFGDGGGDSGGGDGGCGGD